MLMEWNYLIAAAAFTMTLASFYFKKKAITSVTDCFGGVALSFALLNGISFAVFLENFLTTVPPSVPPALFIVAACGAIAAEFFGAGRASVLLHLYICIIEILMLSLANSTSLLIIGVITNGYRAVQLDNGTLVAISLIASMTLASIFLFLLSRARSFPVEEISEMLRQRQRYALAVLYIVLCAVSLLYSVKHIERISLGSQEEAWELYGVLAIIVLKDGLTVISGLLLLLLHGQAEGSSRLNTIMLGQLSRNREFARLAHGTVIGSYSADLTKDRVEEGRKIIKREYLAPSYRSLLDSFIDSCVHPDDVEFIRSQSDIDFHRSRLDTNPSFSYRFRAAPGNLLRMLELPDDAVEKFSKTQKAWVHLAVNGLVTEDPATKDLYAFIYLVDIDEDIRQYENMKQSATFDSLTGVCNRRSLQELISSALSNEGTKGALFMIDLDNFKTVNDVLGHPEGDRLLKDTAALLKREFRSADIIGRLGGDEFMAFSLGLSNPDDVIRKAQRLNECGRIDVPNEDGDPIHVSFSIGVAIFPRDAAEYDSLYKRADIALYVSKLNGKDRATLYEEGMQK